MVESTRRVSTPGKAVALFASGLVLAAFFSQSSFLTAALLVTVGIVLIALSLFHVSHKVSIWKCSGCGYSFDRN